MKKFKLTESPFLKSALQPEVYVAGGNDPYANTQDVLKKIDISAAYGKKVLLKPNAGRIALPGEGINTDTRVVAAAIDAFVSAGASVAVGESPITGVNALEAFDSSGITKVAGKRKCPLIDMDTRQFVEVHIPDGKAIHSLKMCSDILEYDIVVSIAVMKMHMHTGVTLSIKNMKGCLWRRSKTDLHMLPLVDGLSEMPLNIAITDMAGILRPHLSIIDGTVGMEGLGPSAGDAKPLGVVVAGADAFAADSIACGLMGIQAENIPHLRMGAERGYGVIDIDRIKVLPDNWNDWSSDFSLPPENFSIVFPDVDILDKNSCSACQSTLFLFLKEYTNELFDFFPSNENIHIAIGKGHEKVPTGTLCIGNCTDMHRNSGIFVPGCPPVGSKILQAISGKQRKNIKKK